MTIRIALLGSAILLAAMFTTPAAAALFVPTALAPGSSYHLVSITRDGRDATSGVMGDYDSFVNAQAALNPSLTGTNVGVTYSVVGSTSTADARVHAVVSAPVYNFNDQLIATSFADLWDGTLHNPIAFDQFVNPGFPDLFTGTDLNGFGMPGSELGTAMPRSGLGNLATSAWIDDSIAPQTLDYRFYGLRETLINSSPLWPSGCARIKARSRRRSGATSRDRNAEAGTP